MPPAARILDLVDHKLPPMLVGGPTAITVLIGGLPAWRGVNPAAALALQVAKKISDTAIQVAENATKAAAGTPGLPAAKAAEELVKTGALAAMSATISAAAGGADIHGCLTPLPAPPHGPGVVITPSATVMIAGMPAAREGDTILEALGPPNKIKKGCPTVKIGD